MAKYYFHIRRGSDIARDPEGAEFASLTLAHDEAVAAARELLAQAVMRGDIVDGHAFEITDEDGKVVDSIRFRDTMRLE
jgi:hypothetical protein